jgi:hypothetical protein
MPELNSDTTVVDDDKPVTEDDLRALKYPEEEVETSQEEDETSEGTGVEESEGASEEDGQTDDQTIEEEIPAFVKQFDYIKGDTPEEYAKNLEQAYENSSTEGRRINAELQELKKAPTVTPEKTDEEETPKSATELYVQQKLDQEIQEAFSVIRKDYPQASNPDEYAKFTREVATFSRTILDGQGRLASPAELYAKAAISLGWEKNDAEPDDKDKLGMALKDGAATSKTTSAPTKPKPTGAKVSETQLKLNRKMYPGKTDQQIIDELTPYL